MGIRELKDSFTVTLDLPGGSPGLSEATGKDYVAQTQTHSHTGVRPQWDSYTEAGVGAIFLHQSW